MLRFLRKRRSGAAAAQFGAPGAEDRVIYAVGDIHGRHDLLRRLLDRILEDAATAELKPVLVFLGDYIDRGEGARESVELLRSVAEWREPQTVFLMGNHEQMLLRFLRDPGTGEHWLRFGGLQTLMSYGVRSAAKLHKEDGALRVRAELSAVLGPDLGFIEGLRLSHRAGNLFFAHAGADPAKPVDEQDVTTLLWGCRAFHRSDRDDGIWVVHGHTVVERPVAERGRISVDTGAYFSGRLTAARIASGAVTFLET